LQVLPLLRPSSGKARARLAAPPGGRTRFRPGNGFIRQHRIEAIGRYPLEDNGLRWGFWFVHAPCLRLPFPSRDRLSRPVPRGPRSSRWRLPAWLALRIPILDDAKLASFAAEKAEAIGRYPFEVRRLAIDSDWLRSAFSRRPLGLGCILPGRCGMTPAALRPVKVAVATTTEPFRKICAILIFRSNDLGVSINTRAARRPSTWAARGPASFSELSKNIRTVATS